VAVVALVTAEVTARALSGQGGNGLPRFRHWALLPFRPDAADVGDALARAEAAEYQVPDPELGWTLGRSVSSPPYATNAQGFRGDPDREIALEVPSGAVRVVACGDSFTHGDGVPLEETWTWQLGQASAELEVVNLGVPAYGTDQAYLRWRRHRDRGLRSQVAVLGIWPENVCRNLNRVRFYLQPAGPFRPKPRFRLEDGELVLVPPPAREELPGLLAEARPLAHERWQIPSEVASRPWYALRTARIAATARALLARREERDRLYTGADPAGNEVTVAIARRFAADAAEVEAAPIVGVLPFRDLLERFGDGSLPLVAGLRDADLDVVDLFPAFAQAEGGWGPLFQADGHLSAEGNALVARELAQRLRDRGLID